LKRILLFISILFILFVISSCLNEMQGQKITIQKQTGEEYLFEDFKEVTQKSQVKKAIAIVENADWKKGKIEKEHFANFQFQFPFKNSNVSEDKTASYLVWVNPNGENLELGTDSNRYVQLTKQNSAELYVILTGEKLVK
jgi:hypothetical protein